jgi:hypothetical protein
VAGVPQLELQAEEAPSEVLHVQAKEVVSTMKKKISKILLKAMEDPQAMAVDYLGYSNVSLEFQISSQVATNTGRISGTA